MCIRDRSKAEALFQQAQSLLAAGKYQQAADLLDRVAVAQPKSSRGAQSRALSAIALARIKRTPAALARLESASRAADSLDDATRDFLSYERACCLRALDSTEGAASLLKGLAEG